MLTDTAFSHEQIRYLEEKGICPICMDEKTIDSMFVLARELCEKYKPNHKVKLPYMLRQVEKAFDNNDIELWKLASCYQ